MLKESGSRSLKQHHPRGDGRLCGQGGFLILTVYPKIWPSGIKWANRGRWMRQEFGLMLVWTLSVRYPCSESSVMSGDSRSVQEEESIGHLEFFVATWYPTLKIEDPKENK